MKPHGFDVVLGQQHSVSLSQLGNPRQAGSIGINFSLACARTDDAPATAAAQRTAGINP